MRVVWRRRRRLAAVSGTYRPEFLSFRLEIGNVDAPRGWAEAFLDFCLFLPTSARMFSPPISLVIVLSFLYPRFYDLWKAQLTVKVG